MLQGLSSPQLTLGNRQAYFIIRDLVNIPRWDVVRIGVKHRPKRTGADQAIGFLLERRQDNLIEGPELEPDGADLATKEFL